ncbi:tryptophan-rich sensory protein [Thermoleophilia bacterium SCSIO 60948]|nr:tryptophan-rich sensory protein [Thermoleophilia bacterium SCSIO 60948]
MSAGTTALRRPASTAAIAAGWGAAVAAVAIAGGLGSDTDSAWYRSLDLPAFQPPGAAFGIVWTVLYVLIAISATLATRDVPGAKRRLVVGLFAANLVLNVAWTWIFFKGEQPVAAGVEILFLLATIAGLIRLIAPHNRSAAFMLAPYAAWVCFATVLTWTIAATN